MASSLTLADLIVIVERGEVDPILSLREVSDVAGVPYTTVRCWVYRDHSLPTIPYGPACRPGVRASNLLRIVCQRTSAGRLVLPIQSLAS